MANKIINLGGKMDKFQKELGSLINRHSLENGSNTPDFLLAEYLVNCLKAFNRAVQMTRPMEISSDKIQKAMNSDKGKLLGKPNELSRTKR